MTQDVELLVAPLVVSLRYGLNSSLGPGARLNPSKYSIIKHLHHWAIQITDTCYEVTSIEDESCPGKKVYDLRIIPATAWWGIRDLARVEVDRNCVAQTTWIKDELEIEARNIWRTYHNSKYNLYDQNCQNFCWLFTQQIASNGTLDPQNAPAWRAMPLPVNHRLAAVGKIGLAADTKKAVGLVHAVGTKAATGTALTVAGSPALGTHSALVTSVPAMHATCIGVGTVHAAAFGASTVKAGAVVSAANPLLGCVVIGVGAGVLALAERREKKWAKRQRELRYQTEVQGL